MKKLFAPLLASALLLLSGCAQQDDGKIKIGASFCAFNDTFQMYMKDAMDAKAAELGDVDIVYTDGKEDITQQLAQVENFIAQGMDSIIVCPSSTDATKPITNAAIKAGIDIVYLNRKPDYMPDGTYYVGSDERVAGNIQGQFVADKLHGKGKVGILMGIPGGDNTLNRTEGVKEIIAQNEDMSVIREQTGRWMRDLGMTVAENWISAGDNLAAIIANNDDMALGAITALEANNMKDDVIVVGVDATPDALAYMEEGRLDATVFQDAKGQGEGSLMAAYKLAKKEPVEKETWIPFELVTPENYKNYL